jgi:hypothetical protein
MSAATTPLPTTEPSRSERLLGLVRKLIEYGKELAATIRQRAATNPLSIGISFGTIDVAVILASISRGLQRASELEARVLRNAACLDTQETRAKRRSAPRAPSAPLTEAAEPRVVTLPTSAWIAAQVRRRPIGAVIADICRDLGIMCDHPLWREIHLVITIHNGNYPRLVMDILNRAFVPPAPPAPAGDPAALLAPTLRFEAPSSTGPP